MEKADFIKRLVALRVSKGASARDMSLSLGQSAGYINNIENGVNYPSMTVFFYICDYLGISPKEFFDTETLNPSKANGQKDLAAFAANDRVHLDNGDIGIVCHKRREILVGAPFIAVSIDFQLRRSPSRTHPDDAGTIHLVSVEQTGVQIIVGGLFADHQLVCIIHKSMMDRLSVLDERRNNLIDVLQLQRVDCKPLPTLGEGSLIGSVRVVRLVLVLSQRASLFVLAVSADVGRFGELWAHFFNEVRAVLIAVLAVAAALSSAQAGIADICFLAVVAMDARIEATPVGTFCNRNSM